MPDTYFVHRHERHLVRLKVEADSPEEAVARAMDGQGEYDGSEYIEQISERGYDGYECVETPDCRLIKCFELMGKIEEEKDKL